MPRHPPRAVVGEVGGLSEEEVRSRKESWRSRGANRSDLALTAFRKLCCEWRGGSECEIGGSGVGVGVGVGVQ